MTSTKSTRLDASQPSSVRIDRWLWAARFFKTRSLAKAAIEGGKIHLNGQRLKPSKAVCLDQMLEISRGGITQTVIITGLAENRGPAPEAAKLYRETSESIERREAERARRQMQRAGLRIPATRPSKKDRREIKKLKSLPGDAT